MFMRILFTILFLFSFHATAAIGGSDAIDLMPMPNEFCNSKNKQTQQDLLKRYPKNVGIINIYAMYLGLCQLVKNGSIDENTAGIHWAIERDKLLESLKAASK